MKWLLTPLLWILAVAVALFVLWRLARGRNVVLAGRFAPRFVRMVVIVLVMLGVGVERPAAGAPAAADTGGSEKNAEALPPSLTSDVIGHWLTLQQPMSDWWRLKQQLALASQEPTKVDAATLQQLAAPLPAGLRALLTTELAAREAGKPAPAVSAQELLATLGELEAAGYYDHWLGAYLFRRSASSTSAELYGRLYAHARLANTLLRAQSRVRPIMQRPRAWMSKAYVPAMDRHRVSFAPLALTEMLGACKALYPDSDAGTWERDGIAQLRVGKQSAALSLLQRGTARQLAPGQPLRLGRLDLISAPAGPASRPAATLESAWLGELQLPAGHPVSVWELPRALSREAQAKVAQTITAALESDEQAAERLELHLPLVHALLRAELARAPQARGAARLRLILSLYDDAVMPALARTEPTWQSLE